MNEPDQIGKQKEDSDAEETKEHLLARERKTFLQDWPGVVARHILKRLLAVRNMIRRVNDHRLFWNLDDVTALRARTFLARKPIVYLEGRHASRAYNTNRHISSLARILVLFYSVELKV